MMRPVVILFHRRRDKSLTCPFSGASETLPYESAEENNCITLNLRALRVFVVKIFYRIFRREAVI